jgi:hypothetical protein
MSAADRLVCASCRIQSGECPDCGAFWSRGANGTLIGVVWPRSFTREQWAAVTAANEHLRAAGGARAAQEGER